MPKRRTPKPAEPTGVERVGTIFFGNHWSADVATATKFSKSWMSRLVDGTREPNEEFLYGLEKIAADKLEGMMTIYDILPLPSGTTPETKAALKALKAAVKDYTKAVRRWKPETPFAPPRGRRASNLKKIERLEHRRTQRAATKTKETTAIAA